MSNDSPNLPVAYTLWECSGCGIIRETEAEITSHLGGNENYDERPIAIELTEVSDAEEAIQEARRQERREILNKHKELRQEEIQKHGHKPKAYEHAKERLLERIREDLESSEHTDSAEGLRDDLEDKGKDDEAQKE